MRSSFKYDYISFFIHHTYVHSYPIEKYLYTIYNYILNKVNFL